MKEIEFDFFFNFFFYGRVIGFFYQLYLLFYERSTQISMEAPNLLWFICILLFLPKIVKIFRYKTFFNTKALFVPN